MDGATADRFHLREGTPRDVPALAALHVRTFRETHGEWPGGPTVALREQQWRDAFESRATWFCFVIESAESLVGFSKGLARDEAELPEFKGELNKIYLLNKVQGLGLGRQLVCATARKFLALGIGSMVLFGDAHSPSNGFYEHLGADRLYAPTGEFHGGYGWRDLTLLLARCD